MLIHLFLSTSAFERIIKLRLLGEFRPIDETILFNGQPCYMDGLQITSLELVPSSRIESFTVNGLVAGDAVGPVGSAIGVAPVTVRLVGAVLLSSAASVRAAGLVQADQKYGLPDRPDALRIPILNAEFDVFLTVSPKGVPTLQVTLRSLPGAELLGDASSFVDGLRNLSLPFPVAAAFADLLPGGRTRVLNAGAAILNDGLAFRFEFEQTTEGVQQRLNEWMKFFNGRSPSRLDGLDWAIEVPTAALMAEAARSIDEQLSGAEIRKSFTPTGNAWGSFDPGDPGFHFTKEGILESACGGLDIRAEILADVHLSVPAPNVLRIQVDLDIDLNDWDSFKCFGLSLINPFAGIITTIDKHLPWWAFVPVSVLLPLAPIAFGFGGDDLVVREAIKSAQDKVNKGGGPTLVRDSLSSFHVDIGKTITTDLTRDWLVINAVSGAGDRLVLRGAFTAPDLDTLPRLRGLLTDPFEFWSKKDRCSSNAQWLTVATLTLGLEDAGGTPVYTPIVPIRYGIDIETVAGKQVAVGQVTWRIIDDPGNVYGSTSTRIHWTGRPPGVFEVEVLKPPEAFGQQPYPFRMRIFTSVGVREFEIPAPPPLPRPPETREEVIAEAAERISGCYIFSTLLTRVKALQVFWLPNPPPGQKVGQHWQARVGGLGPGERVRAWNAETRELLAEVGSFNGADWAEISLALPAARTMLALQLTLNGAPFLDAPLYARRAAGMKGRQKEGPNPVLVRQTPLYPVAEIELDEMMDVVVPQRGADHLRLLLHGPAGGRRIDLDLLDPVRRLSSVRLVDAPPPRPQLPSRFFTLNRAVDGERATLELKGSGIRGHTQVIARYFARPWYDRGGVADDFYVQLDDSSTRLTVYRRGATREPTPDLGERFGATSGQCMEGQRPGQDLAST